MTGLRRAGALATASLLVLLGGCGQDVSGTGGDTGPDVPEVSPVLTRDGERLLSCGGGAPAFPAAAVSDGVTGLADPAQVKAALVAHATRAGIDAPQALQGVAPSDVAWRVLGGSLDDPTGSLLVGLGEWGDPGAPVGGEVVVVQRDGEQLDVTGSSTCRLTPALVDGAVWAELAVEPGALDAASSSLVLQVTERECTSARDPEPFLREPVVEERDDEVVISWTSDAVVGTATCPGNPSVARTVELAAPLGDRAVLDGSTVPPRLLGRAEAAPVDEPADVMHCSALYPRYDDVASLLASSDLVVRGTVTAERVYEELPLDAEELTPEVLEQVATTSTAWTVEVHEVVAGDLAGRAAIEVGATGTRRASATSCGAETPLDVGSEYVLVLDAVDLDRPVPPLNPYEAIYRVTGDGGLVASSPQNLLAPAVDSLDDLRAPTGG